MGDGHLHGDGYFIRTMRYYCVVPTNPDPGNVTIL